MGEYKGRKINTVGKVKSEQEDEKGKEMWRKGEVRKCKNKERAGH